MSTALQEEICLSSCLLNLTTNSCPIINILRYHQIFWIALVSKFVEFKGLLLSSSSLISWNLKFSTAWVLLLWNTFAQKLANKVLFCNWNCLDIVVRIVLGGTLTASLSMSCNFFSSQKSCLGCVLNPCVEVILTCFLDSMVKSDSSFMSCFDLVL